jgi:hypothetical protein
MDTEGLNPMLGRSGSDKNVVRDNLTIRSDLKESQCVII